MKKRILALVLAAVLIFSCIGTSVFAGGGEETNSLAKYTKGTGYVAFGDSIARGFAATDAWITEGYRIDEAPLSDPLYIKESDTYKNLDDLKNISLKAYNDELALTDYSVFCRNVTGSYTKQIADELGCISPENMTTKDANYWPMVHDAQTTDQVLDLLGIEDNFVDNDFYQYKNSQNHYLSDLFYFGSNYSALIDGTGKYQGTANAVDARSLVNDASLITIALGMGEVFNRAQAVAQRKYDLSDEPAECIEEIVKQMYIGYNNFTTHYPLLLNYIKEKNLNATVILIGAINPFYGMTITDETIVPVGNALSSITMLMNQQYKKWAKEYGYSYLDVSNVDTGTVSEEMDFITFFGIDGDTVEGEIAQGIPTHPSPAGYNQIARMAINILKEKENTETPVQTKNNNIVVDLGRDEQVNYVLVDGKLLSKDKYSVKDYVLTIPYNRKNAKNLTVAVLDDHNKLSFQTYELTYNNGYTAYRFYQSNDVSKTLSKPASLLKKAGNWFVGLFKK